MLRKAAIIQPQDVTFAAKLADRLCPQILLEGYQAGEPVIIETASIWWNLHVHDWQLAEVPDEDILHIYPPDPLAEVPEVPQPALGGDEEPALRAWLGNRQSFWRIVTLDAPGYYNAVFDQLQAEGYGKDFTLLYDKLLVIHYRRVDNPEAGAISFGDMLHLQQWEVEGNLAPCQSIWLYTIWSASSVPSQNYNLRVRLVNAGQEVWTVADRPLGQVPTQLWQPHDLYLDERPLAIPCDLQGDDYGLEISVYTSSEAGFTNLPAASEAGEVLGEFPILTRIEIKP